jgi:hypothetical protein
VNKTKHEERKRKKTKQQARHVFKYFYNNLFFEFCCLLSVLKLVFILNLIIFYS